MPSLSLSSSFQALLREAQFTNEMLGAGATEIRNATYASKGLYFQSFTSLSTGLERIGKLCVLLDHLVETGTYPDPKYLKRTYGHGLVKLYEASTDIVLRRELELQYLKRLEDPVHQGILTVLSAFAEGDRYANINLLGGSVAQNDPIHQWYMEVDRPLYEKRVSARRKESISRNASLAASVYGATAFVLNTSESGEMVTSIEDASTRTGIAHAVGPLRQLYVLQIIRYWFEVLLGLQYVAMGCNNDIPHFGEIFAIFGNDDSLLRSRKTWRKP